jgi:hypothetical protein
MTETKGTRAEVSSVLMARSRYERGGNCTLLDGCGQSQWFFMKQLQLSRRFWRNNRPDVAQHVQEGTLLFELDVRE